MPGNKVTQGIQSRIRINIDRGLLPLFGVSVIVFVFTLSFYFMLHYLSEGWRRQNAVTGWEYVYSDSSAVTADETMRVYSAQTPIITEKDAVRDYVYFVKTFEASDIDRTLVVLTDYSPVKISVNGFEVYNNHYDGDKLVGNCYNAITLEGTDRAQTVEISMRLPLSVRFECMLFDKAGQAAFMPSAGLIVGGILFVLGLAALTSSLIIYFKRRRYAEWIGLSGMFAYCGAAILLYRLPECTYLFNDRSWLNFFTFVAFSVFFTGAFSLIRYYRKDTLPILVTVGSAAFSALLTMMSFGPVLYRLSCALLTAAAVCGVLYAVKLARRSVRSRTQYASALFIVGVYYVMSILLAGLLLLCRATGLYIFTVTISTFVVIGTLGYMSYAKYRFAKTNQELQEQSRLYSECVEHISRFIRNMLAFRSEDGFFEAAADQIAEIVEKYGNAGNSVKFGVAVRRQDGLCETVNRDLTDCRYDLIEKNYFRHGHNCHFCETYFEFLLKKNDSVHTIFHFEGIVGGLNVFFDSMVEIAYSALEIAFENLSRTVRHHRAEDIIFGQLAENAETDSSSYRSHLEKVGKYTVALCRQLGFDEETARSIGAASKLHDIGKIAVPRSILLKQSRLNEEERLIVRNHTRFGDLILSAYEDDPLLKTAAEIAKYHHENYDGSGYCGLAGEEIPLTARIVTVCDVFDALTSERSYKKAWSVESAFRYIDDNAGKLFDPAIVTAFHRTLSDAVSKESEEKV